MACFPPVESLARLPACLPVQAMPVLPVAIKTIINRSEKHKKKKHKTKQKNTKKKEKEKHFVHARKKQEEREKDKGVKTTA